MELMGDGLIAFLAAVGVSAILWLLAETLLRRHSPVAEAVLVLPVRGDGATLERALHLTMEQRATGETPILLADCGLDETGLRLAQGLTQRYSRVQLCPAEELENYLMCHCMCHIRRLRLQVWDHQTGALYHLPKIYNQQKHQS